VHYYGFVASLQQRLPENVPGDFFVDSTCIDCDLLVIPTPGHTRGHVVFLYRKKFLFTGDHRHLKRCISWMKSVK